MKTMTCAEIGGPATCTVSFSAETPEKMIDQSWEHIQQAHPELAKTIKSNSKEMNDEWMAEFKEKFYAAVED
jgi:predicted small metal-binding protein